MYNFYAKLIEITWPKKWDNFYPKMFQYPQTRICPRGENVSISPYNILLRCEWRELDNWKSCKDDYIWNRSTCGSTSKIDKYLDIKNCSCEKSLIPKLVLECEDKILNTTNVSLDDKKGIMRKK